MQRKHPGEAMTDAPGALLGEAIPLSHLDCRRAELNQRRFRRVPPAMNDSMLDLDGLSPVSGKAVFARFDGGQLQTVFTQKRLFICSIRVTPWYFRAPGGVASLSHDQGQRVRLESRK
jgi:hypothetical protein